MNAKSFDVKCSQRAGIQRKPERNDRPRPLVLSTRCDGVANITRMDTEKRSNQRVDNGASISGDRCSPVLEEAIRTAVRHLDSPALARLQVELEQSMRTPAEVAWLRRLFTETRLAVRSEGRAAGDTAGRIASAAIVRAKGG